MRKTFLERTRSADTLCKALGSIFRFREADYTRKNISNAKIQTKEIELTLPSIIIIFVVTLTM
jgi:hypothetical protein